MRKQARIHIGTSGWHYDHWRGRFYPEDLTKEDFLKYYQNQFHTVEINNSFYQLPKKETIVLLVDHHGSPQKNLTVY